MTSPASALLAGSSSPVSRLMSGSSSPASGLMSGVSSPVNNLLHSAGAFSARTYTASGTGKRSAQKEQQQVIQGTVAGVDHNTGELIIKRPGGSLVRASSIGGNPLPGKTAQVTLGSPQQGNRRAIAGIIRESPKLINNNGAVANPTFRAATEVDLPCAPTDPPGSVSGPTTPEPPPEAPESPFDPLDPEDPSDMPSAYECVGSGQCIESENGIFATRTNCLAAGCTETSYSCIDQRCTLIPDGSGQFSSLAACIASQCEPPGVACILGECQEVAVGAAFEDFEQCWASDCLTCQAYAVSWQAGRSGDTPFGTCFLSTLDGTVNLTGKNFSIRIANSIAGCSACSTNEGPPGQGRNVVIDYVNCAGNPQSQSVASASVACNIYRDPEITNVVPL